MAELREVLDSIGDIAVASRSDLEDLATALLQHEIPVLKPVRLLGVSLSSLQDDDRDEPQLGLPI